MLKGVAMGCADLIPGVSGGSVALITGIYEQLINSIRSFDQKALGMLIRFKIKELWKHIDGQFLIQIFSGLLISVFSFARFFAYLLENYAIPLWSFFFGLILASSLYILKPEKSYINLFFIATGAILALAITSLNPLVTPEKPWFIFLCGAIANMRYDSPRDFRLFYLDTAGKVRVHLKCNKVT